MKRCPTCKQTFAESHLSFCTDDGTPLVTVDDAADAVADEATVVRSSSGSDGGSSGSSDSYGRAAESPAPAYRPPGSSLPPDYQGLQGKRKVWPWVLGCSAVLLGSLLTLAIVAKILFPKVPSWARNTNTNQNGNLNRNESNSNSSNWNENLNSNSGDATTPAPTDEAKVLSDLTDLEREWTVANINADKKKLNRILADDYVGVLPNGKLQGKAEYLKTATPDDAIQKWEFENLKVSLYGDRATLTGVLQLDVRDEQGQNQSLAFRFTDKFVWRDGRWQATASEVTPVKQQGVAA